MAERPVSQQQQKKTMCIDRSSRILSEYPNSLTISEHPLLFMSLNTTPLILPLPFSTGEITFSATIFAFSHNMAPYYISFPTQKYY